MLGIVVEEEGVEIGRFEEVGKFEVEELRLIEEEVHWRKR